MLAMSHVVLLVSMPKGQRNGRTPDAARIINDNKQDSLKLDQVQNQRTVK